MKLNYIMLPENIQHRLLPGHRHRAQKVSQTFSPMSRAGRRAQGEAKETATMAGKAKKKEEDRAKEFTKFVKTLNRKVAAHSRAAPHAGEVVEVDSAPRTRTSNRIAAVAAWLARAADAASSSSRLSKEPKPTKPATERVEVEITTSSRVTVEDVPRPHSSINQIQVVSNVIDVNNTNQHQTLVGSTDTRLVNGGILYHQLPNANTIQNQLPFDQHAVHGVITPAFPRNAMAHRDVLFPGPEIHDHDYLELERTAIACAYLGMDEPMDISPDFPAPVTNDDYMDLERTAISCAYAAMDEPMDTALDDTQGPVVHQDAPRLIGFVGNFQERQFDHAIRFQPPIYETLRPPGHQHLIDHDYRLYGPATNAHIDNQIFPQTQQEHFVNENIPLHHYYQTGHDPHAEEYLGILPDFGHNAPIPAVVQQAFYEQNILRMTRIQQPENHHQHIGHGVHFHLAVQEERINEGPLQQPLNGLDLEQDLRANWNAGGGLQHVGEEGHHDDPGLFVNVFGANVEEQEQPNRHTGEAYILDRIEVLFGDSGKDDDDDNEDEDDDDEDDNEEENELHINF